MVEEIRWSRYILHVIVIIFSIRHGDSCLSLQKQFYDHWTSVDGRCLLPRRPACDETLTQNILFHLGACAKICYFTAETTKIKIVPSSVSSNPMIK